MLQQALEQLLRSRGWVVRADGGILVAQRDDEDALVGFVARGEAEDFVARCREASAVLVAILMPPIPEEEVARLEEAGVVCFSREEAEDAVMAGLLHPEQVGSTPLVRCLEGA